MKFRLRLPATVRECLEDDLRHAESCIESHSTGWGMRSNIPCPFIPSDRPYWEGELVKAKAALQRHDELTALIHQSIADSYKEK